MSADAIFAVTRQGLDYERARMEAASRRIAMANVPLSQSIATKAPAGTAFSESVSASGKTGGVRSLASEPNDGAREVIDPSHPMAGQDGKVRYPDIDMAEEMTTLMSAQRGYQADIRAFNTLHNMMLKSLEIGGR